MPARDPGTSAAKPRPYVVVPRTNALDAPPKVAACSLTTSLRGVAGQRPFVVPTSKIGLRQSGDVQVDWINTHPTGRIGGVIGTVDRPTLAAIDVAVARWHDR